MLAQSTKAYLWSTRPDHNTGIYVPYYISARSAGVGSVTSPANHVNCRCMRRNLQFIGLYPRRLERLLSYFKTLNRGWSGLGLKHSVDLRKAFHKLLVNFLATSCISSSFFCYKQFPIFDQFWEIGEAFSAQLDWPWLSVLEFAVATVSGKKLQTDYGKSKLHHHYTSNTLVIKKKFRWWFGLHF